MQLSNRDWLALKPETRQALAKIFRLNRSSFTHVVDNHVESDGYTYQDLSAITVEEMKRLTHLESDNFEEQFKVIVKMVEGHPLVATEPIKINPEDIKPGRIINFNAEDIKPGIVINFNADEMPAEKNATNGNATTNEAGSKTQDKGTVSAGSGSKTQAPAGKK
jgi:hypothetical protein